MTRGQENERVVREALSDAIDFIEREHPQMPSDLNTILGQLKRARKLLGLIRYGDLGSERDTEAFRAIAEQTGVPEYPSEGGS